VKSRRITEITVEIEETFTIRRSTDSISAPGPGGSQPDRLPTEKNAPPLLQGDTTPQIYPQKENQS
jgi:hypothetical protein